jgi:hypothetical protein
VGATPFAGLGLLITFAGLVMLVLQGVYSRRPTTSRLGKASPFVAVGLLVLGFAWLYLSSR